MNYWVKACPLSTILKRKIMNCEYYVLNRSKTGHKVNLQIICLTHILQLLTPLNIFHLNWIFGEGKNLCHNSCCSSWFIFFPAWNLQLLNLKKQPCFFSFAVSMEYYVGKTVQHKLPLLYFGFLVLLLNLSCKASPCPLPSLWDLSIEREIQQLSVLYSIFIAKVVNSNPKPKSWKDTKWNLFQLPSALLSQGFSFS